MNHITVALSLKNMKSTKILAVLFLCLVVAFTIGCNKESTPQPIDEESTLETPDNETPDTETPDTETPDSETPDVENYTIPTGTLDEVNFQSQVINELVTDIRNGVYPNRHSLLIFKDEKLVLEEYFTGADENWGFDLGVVQHDSTVLHDMRSVSKSVVSACIGIAIAQGKINSIDAPIFDFFVDYNQHNNAGRQGITIRHLLTMTSGLEWNEDVPYTNPANSELQMINSGDGIDFVLSRAIVEQPGTVWRYNGGNTELLAAILQRATGKNVHDFAKEFLFEPLDISASEWTITPATNSPAGASGLRLTSRGMLKFGMLYQNEGTWGEEQVVPKEWVSASLSSSITRPGGGGYGYQFWIYNYTTLGKTVTIPAAVGNGDQHIYFDKTNNLLVVTTAGNYNLWNIENNAAAVLEEIYQAFDFAESN